MGWNAERMGSTVRERRRREGLRLSGLAERSSMSLGDIVDIEEGLRSATAREISQMASALGENPSHWLRKAGHIHLTASIPEPISHRELERRRRSHRERTLGGDSVASRETDQDSESDCQELVKRVKEKLLKLKESLLTVQPRGLAADLDLPDRVHPDPDAGSAQTAFAVADDGCAPAFRKRDIVALDTEADLPQGAIVLARFPDQQWPLLRARVKVNGKLLYQATNPDWPDWYVSDSLEDPQVEVIGRVRSLIYRRV